MIHLTSSLDIVRANFYCIHSHTADAHPKCWERYASNHKGARIGFLDIEASNIAANFGIVITWCLKIYGEDKIKFGVWNPEKDYMDERILGELISELNKLDYVVTYYGKYFDIPYTRTRAMKFNLPYPPQNKLIHIDMWDIVRKRLKLSNNKLSTVLHFFGKDGKTEIDYDRWIESGYASSNTIRKSALKRILEHNKGDVITLEWLYKKLLPYFRISRTSV